EIFEYPSGLISIAGGKLTGYRKMAEKVVDMVIRRIESKKNLHFPASNTRNILLSGGLFTSEEDYQKKIKEYSLELKNTGVPLKEANILANRYGSNIPDLLSLLPKAKELSSDISISLQLEILYSIYFESALTLSDFFIRRTSYLYFNMHFVKTNQ